MKKLIAMMMVVGCGAFGQLEILGGINTNNPIGFVCTKTNILKDGNTVLSYRIYEKDCEFKLCAFIKETVTTNVYHPKIEIFAETVEVVNGEIQRPFREDRNTQITEIHKTDTIEFDYDGKHFSEQLSHETISTKRQRRVTTEEWVDD